jgi:hypothetical protein
MKQDELMQKDKARIQGSSTGSQGIKGPQECRAGTRKGRYTPDLLTFPLDSKGERYLDAQQGMQHQDAQSTRDWDRQAYRS